jgi:two-component system NarL family sensor kinase
VKEISAKGPGGPILAAPAGAAGARPRDLGESAVAWAAVPPRLPAVAWWIASEVVVGVFLVAGGALAALASGSGGTPWAWPAASLLATTALLVLAVVILHLRLHRAARSAAFHEARERLLGAEREALLHEALVVGDRERQHLAADLHDGVIQLVSAVTLRTATLARGLRRPGEATPERLQEAAASLDRITVDLQAVTADLRTLMGALAGGDVQNEGLTGALSALLLPLAEGGTQVELSVGEVSGDAETRTLIHRVAQELIRNVAKHAAAQRVSVSVGEEGESIRLRISDDGRGFDVTSLEERRHRGHLGLRLAGQRVRDAEGELSIHSAPGRGTTVEVTVPAQRVAV